MQETEIHAANMRIQNEVELEVSESKLAMQKKKDQRAHEKELMDLERAEKKEQQEMEKQRNKDDQENKKAEAEIERMKKKDEAQHAKAVKDLEAKAKKNCIDREERDGLMEELAQETERYNKEFELASHAMKESIKTKKGCRISHTAPKIEWGNPPRVIPGSVSWHAGGW